MHIENKDQSFIHQKVLHFQFRLDHEPWQTVRIPLENLKKNDLCDDETLAEDILEVIYAMDPDTYERRDDIEFCVSNFWKGIVIPCHEAIYKREIMDDFD